MKNNFTVNVKTLPQNTKRTQSGEPDLKTIYKVEGYLSRSRNTPWSNDASERKTPRLIYFKSRIVINGNG